MAITTMKKNAKEGGAATFVRLLMLCMCALKTASIKLSVSYCNVCYTGTSCDQNYYIHWGDDKLGSCNDSSAPLDDDYKTAFGNVNTPHGPGPYHLLNGNAAVDQVLSQITGRDGSVYTCYRANGHQFTNWCGATYACSVGLSCYGPA